MTKSAHVRRPAPRARRSHAERTAETRERVMRAVVESITLLGYQKTTSAEIARRAGVTWGAVQHHFGDKDGILTAVLADSFGSFADTLGNAPDDETLEKRVSVFVLEIVELPEASLDTAELIARLPADPGDGYELDLSSAAARLAGTIAAQPWHGLFVAFDYGRTWRELTEDSPAGTARAYRAHRQHNDLLADPGEQDLTCHVCWDEIIDAVARRGFRGETIESQEAFFIRHARDAVEALVTGAPRGPDPMRLQLQQLIHPTLMGQKFQVLTARRTV
jgi:AcrR family transcriptional regulator